MLVNNLESDKQYFYYIVAADSSAEPSNIVGVRTNIVSSTNEDFFAKAIVSADNKHVRFKHLAPNTLVEVFAVNGQKLYAAVSSADAHSVSLNTNGIYIVRLTYANQSKAMKVVI